MRHEGAVGIKITLLIKSHEGLGNECPVFVAFFVGIHSETEKCRFYQGSRAAGTFVVFNRHSLVPSTGEYFMKFWRIVCYMVVSLAAALGQARESDFADDVKKPVASSIRIRQDTQKQEEQWREDKQRLLARYNEFEQSLHQLKIRRQTLEETNAAARHRISAKQQQLADIEQVEAQIEPLIDTQMDLLGRHLDQDLPFLPDERRQRLERLSALRHDPDVAVSEKFRKVLEALMVEAEYGNTIEVYQQNISIGERNMLVNVFRLGRISLFFQTLDHTICGFFDVASGGWEALPAAYNRTLQAAIEIGAKRQPVEILALPLGRMRVP